MATAGQHTGYFIDVEGSTGLVGAPRLFSAAGEGEVHVLDMPHPAAVEFCFCEDALSDCGNEDLQGGCRNSNGLGARLKFCGSASVTADDSSLVASGLRANTFALLFMGGGTSLGPLGAGLRCTSGGGTGQFRYPAVFTGSAGVAALEPGFVAFTQSHFPSAGQIAAGDTWYFQCWYRDPNGACGLHLNLTNAVGVTFQP